MKKKTLATKISAALMSAILVMSMTACGGDDGSQGSSGNGSQASDDGGAASDESSAEAEGASSAEGGEDASSEGGEASGEGENESGGLCFMSPRTWADAPSKSASGGMSTGTAIIRHWTM